MERFEFGRERLVHSVKQPVRALWVPKATADNTGLQPRVIEIGAGSTRSLNSSPIIPPEQFLMKRFFHQSHR